MHRLCVRRCRWCPHTGLWTALWTPAELATPTQQASSGLTSAVRTSAQWVEPERMSPAKSSIGRWALCSGSRSQRHDLLLPRFRISHVLKMMRRWHKLVVVALSQKISKRVEHSLISALRCDPLCFSAGSRLLVLCFVLNQLSHCCVSLKETLRIFVSPSLLSFALCTRRTFCRSGPNTMLHQSLLLVCSILRAPHSQKKLLPG